MVSLCELHYLPSVRVLAFLSRPDDHLVLEAWEHHQKGSFRNRCRIDGANGIQSLSIPLRKGKHQQMPVKEVRIAHEVDWPLIHWRTIVSAYGRSPYFEHYRDALEACYRRKERFLWDWNLRLMELLVRVMALPGGIGHSEGYAARPMEGAIDLRGRIPVHGGHPPPGLRDVPYPQVFSDRHPFLPGLSGLDLLFCAGPASRAMLSSMRLPDNLENTDACRQAGSVP